MDKVREKMMEERLVAEIPERIRRALEIKKQIIVPANHFTPVSAEVFDLYRDGHFYGVISLTQSIVEALALFMCEKDKLKLTKNIKTNLDRLSSINKDTKAKFIEIWGDKGRRNDYHHLNKNLERDRRKLGIIAIKNIKLLSEIEQEVFYAEIKGGNITNIKYSQYWDLKDGKAIVHLRID